MPFAGSSAGNPRYVFRSTTFDVPAADQLVPAGLNAILIV